MQEVHSKVVSLCVRGWISIQGWCQAEDTKFRWPALSALEDGSLQAELGKAVKSAHRSQNE